MTLHNIPPVTKNLLIINVVVFLFCSVVNILFPYGNGIDSLFGLHFFLAKDFHFFQLFTYMFMHGGFLHIAMNMFMLFMFGMVIERVWGSRKFLIYYIICGLGAAFCQELAQFTEIYFEVSSKYSNFGLMDMWSIQLPQSGVTVGASGAIYGVLLAFGLLFPDERMFIFPLPIPIKAKWIILGSVGVELLSALSTTNDGVAHLAHLGGMLFGFLLMKYWQYHPYSGYTGFGKSRGQQFFDKMRSNWEQRSPNYTASPGPQYYDAQPETDWEYNARKQREQEEIDKILDKIRKSGYDSLTKDEKLRLFEQGNKRK